MARMRQCRFHIFRYQLLPVSQSVQLELAVDNEPPITGLDDLLRRKNEMLARAIEGIDRFQFARTEIIHRVEASEDSFYVLRLGAGRGVKVTTREFLEENIENWPCIYVIFDNDPEVQKVAIQRDPKVFYRTPTVANILEKNLNRYLRTRQLVIRFMPIFEQSFFWDIVERYDGRITQTEFEMISPNLSNISAALSLDLGELHRTTNTQETRLQLKSDVESSLTFDRDDQFIEALVRYAAQGGGNVTIKVRGLNKRIQTAKGVTEISVDKAQIENAAPQDIARIFKEILR